MPLNPNKHTADFPFTVKCASSRTLELTQKLTLQIKSRRWFVSGDWDLSLCGESPKLLVTFKFCLPPCFQTSTWWFSPLSTRSLSQRIESWVPVKFSEICKLGCWLIPALSLFVFYDVWSNFPSSVLLFVLSNLPVFPNFLPVFPFLWLLPQSTFVFYAE